jgi:toxin ParE1/3/4
MIRPPHARSACVCRWSHRAAGRPQAHALHAGRSKPERAVLWPRCRQSPTPCSLRPLPCRSIGAPRWPPSSWPVSTSPSRAIRTPFVGVGRGARASSASSDLGRGSGRLVAGGSRPRPQRAHYVTLPIRFSAEASAELANTATWYEEQRAGLGAEFMDAVDGALGARSPDGHTPARPSLTCRRTSRSGVPTVPLPVSRGYIVLDDQIRILAVAHDRRRPAYWTPRADR